MKRKPRKKPERRNPANASKRPLEAGIMKTTQEGAVKEILLEYKYYHGFEHFRIFILPELVKRFNNPGELRKWGIEMARSCTEVIQHIPACPVETSFRAERYQGNSFGSNSLLLTILDKSDTVEKFRELNAEVVSMLSKHNRKFGRVRGYMGLLEPIVARINAVDELKKWAAVLDRFIEKEHAQRKRKIIYSSDFHFLPPAIAACNSLECLKELLKHLMNCGQGNIGIHDLPVILRNCRDAGFVREALKLHKEHVWSRTIAESLEVCENPGKLRKKIKGN